jgi:hypothetical protein
VLLSNGKAYSGARFDWTKRWFQAPDLEAAQVGIQTEQKWRQWLEELWSNVEGLLTAPRAEKLLNTLKQWVQKFDETFSTRLLTRIENLLSIDPKVVAVAYYGTEPSEMPSVKSLGYLAQELRGGLNTLVSVIEDNVLQIRTIPDYMKEIYISPLRSALKR